MRLLQLILTVGFMFFQVACLTDHTEEFEGDFDTYAIEGIESYSEKEIGDTLIIKPKITIAHVEDESDLEYSWTLTYEVNTKWKTDTISKERDLFFVIPGKYGDRLSGQLEVRDKRNDIRYFKIFRVAVKSPFGTGWCFLSEKGENGLLTFVSSTRENHVYDVYALNFETPMPRGKYVEYFPSGKTSTALGVVLEEHAEESFFLDNNFSFVSTLKDRFKSLDYVEGDFKPENMCLEHTAAYHSAIYIMANGKIYARSGYGDITYSYFGAPVGGDYEVGELYGLSGTNSELFVTYDYANHRYIYVPGDDITSVFTYPTPISEGYPFDISNVDVTPIWMGGYDMAYYRDNQFVAVVKNNVTQTYQLHQFHIKKQRVNGVYGYYLQDIKQYDFAEDMSDCKFCTSNKVLYIARGKNLYRLSLLNYGNIEQIPVELDGEITMMEYDTDFSIAVATNGGEGEMIGNVHFISTATETLGQIQKTYYGVGDKIIDMVKIAQNK